MLCVRACGLHEVGGLDIIEILAEACMEWKRLSWMLGRERLHITLCSRWDWYGNVLMSWQGGHA